MKTRRTRLLAAALLLLLTGAGWLLLGQREPARAEAPPALPAAPQAPTPAPALPIAAERVGVPGDLWFVVDQDGRPLADVRAIVAPADRRFVTDATAIAISDALGRVELPPGTRVELPAKLTFCKSGYASAAAVDGQRRVVLERRCVVEGRTVDEGGHPLAEVQVYLSPCAIDLQAVAGVGPFDSGAAADAVQCGVSGPDGRFEIAGLRPGQHLLRVQHAVYGVRRCPVLEGGPLVVPCGFLDVVMTPIWRAAVEFVDDEAVQLAWSELPVETTSLAGASVRWQRPSPTASVAAPQRHLEFHGIPKPADAGADELPFTLFALLRRGGSVRVPLAFRPPATAATVRFASGGAGQSGRLRVDLVGDHGQRFAADLLATSSSGRRGAMLTPETKPDEVAWGLRLPAGTECELPVGHYEVKPAAGYLSDRCAARRVQVEPDQLAQLELSVPGTVCALRVRCASTRVLPRLTLRQRAGETPPGEPTFLDWCYLDRTADGAATVFVPQGNLLVSVYAYGYDVRECELDCRGRTEQVFEVPALQLAR